MFFSQPVLSLSPLHKIWQLQSTNLFDKNLSCFLSSPGWAVSPAQSALCLSLQIIGQIWPVLCSSCPCQTEHSCLPPLFHHLLPGLFQVTFKLISFHTLLFQQLRTGWVIFQQQPIATGLSFILLIWFYEYIL